MENASGLTVIFLPGEPLLSRRTEDCAKAFWLCTVTLVGTGLHGILGLSPAAAGLMRSVGVKPGRFSGLRANGRRTGFNISSAAATVRANSSMPLSSLSASPVRTGRDGDHREQQAPIERQGRNGPAIAAAAPGSDGDRVQISHCSTPWFRRPAMRRWRGSGGGRSRVDVARRVISSQL